ncbi:MAG TPA: TIGR03557 family F420-dependent LLM class oxidoreductase [Planctomycetota bacterium]|nr:TIGR03557 family F420-dependent LLM class oxidoreductase [Planctomycetota bacterium]
MIRLGYALSSEEHGPSELVDLAARAEECGFEYAIISDHFHPWTDSQGESPFVWMVIGGIAERTERLALGTGVTCPTIRIHPVIVAQAAATAAAMMPGRFFLGVGTGEKLNEHVLGDRWPGAEMRLEMLEEAVAVIRTLWQGKRTTFRGAYYTVEDARLYTLPDEPPPIVVAASNPGAAELAGRAGDGFVSTAPVAELVERFQESGGASRPRYGQLTVCYHEDEREARRLAREIWPNGAMGGDLGQELPSPKQYEQIAELVTEEDIAKTVVCSSDPAAFREQIDAFAEAGFDHVYIHQVGPDQEAFFRFFEHELQPAYAAA